MTTPSIDQQLQESIAYIRQQTSQKPRIGLILGSGLGDLADTLAAADRVSTADIPHYPRSTVSGHKGFLVFGNLGEVPVLAVQGRTHFYEGHGIQKVAYVVRIMAEMGINKLFVTNAAGGVNERFHPGDLMSITDQINFMFRNPLTGPVVSGEERWPDMLHSYDPDYRELIVNCGMELGIAVKKGVLFVSSGPSYETAAEVKMIRKLGGDAASMSTVPEVVVAKARKMRVAGISCITNYGTGMSTATLDHQEVTDIAGKVKPRFQELVRTVVAKMDQS